MKAQAINRKQFLQGKFKAQQAIRPPWSVEESRFIDTCTRCFKCAEVCSSRLIVKGSGGFPEMSFIRHGCDYCEACVQACPEDSLSLTQSNHQTPWHQVAHISDQCFAVNGVVCRSCGEVCEAQAIEFKLAVGGKSHININSAICNGCGDCVHVCPAQAIKVLKVNFQDQSGHIPGDNKRLSNNSVSENTGGDKP